MGYIGERNLQQEVNNKIDDKIKLIIDKKLKSLLMDTKEYSFENKKYYLKEDIIGKVLNLQTNMISKMFTEQILSSSGDVQKRSSSNISGREIIGQRLFYHENIEKYVDSVVSTIKF